MVRLALFASLLPLLGGCIIYDTKCRDCGRYNEHSRPDADTGEPDTASQDTATDTATDTGTDTATDTGTDTATDTGADTATDTGADTATDTGADTATDTGTDTGGTTLAAFVLDPSEAHPGEALIASLTATGTFDYASVTEVEAFGDVVLDATTVRDDEILLSLTVNTDGIGTADLLLHLTDGSVEFVPDALAIVTDDFSSESTGPSGDGEDGSSGDGSSGCP
jgi:hypothetical protein